MTHDEKNDEKEVDPEGLPLNRAMKPHDESTPTSPGIRVTDPTPLVARPASYIVGQTAPGQPSAPQVAVEGSRAVQGNSVPEYKWPALNLPDTISAREIYLDDTNPDGRVANRVQR
jgi:hypothetical protein